MREKLFIWVLKVANVVGGIFTSQVRNLLSKIVTL